MGHEVEVISLPTVQDHAAADLSRDQDRGRLPGGCEGAVQVLRARGHPHRHRGADRAGRAPRLHGMEAALHDQLPHPVSGIRLRPPAAAADRRLCLHALVPRTVRAADGGDPHHAHRAGEARLPQHLAVDARGGHRDVQPPPPRHLRASSTRSGSSRGVAGEELEAFLGSTAGTRWWSEGPQRAAQEVIQTVFTGSNSARTWPRSLPSAASRLPSLHTFGWLSRHGGRDARSRPLPAPGPIEIIGIGRSVAARSTR